jgi:hypothetical protein
MTRLATLAVVCSLVLFTSAPAFAKDEKPGGGKPAGGPDTKACQADFEKYCKNVKPGDGRIMVCMQSNMDRLSPECSTAMKEKAAHEKAAREKKMDKKKEADAKSK